jgi:hypothetical protein
MPPRISRQIVASTYEQICLLPSLDGAELRREKMMRYDAMVTRQAGALWGESASGFYGEGWWTGA